MKEELAERLLATVMDWSIEEVTREQPLVRAMASLKYDEYEQFEPGMRFIESLALWLKQFTPESERECAYRFMKERLVFFSEAEIAHFVSMVFPDFVNPILIRIIADELGISKWKASMIKKTPEYTKLLRRCLFLGLSDSAHIDIFRRSNVGELKHDQILQVYELDSEKAKNIKEKLKESGLDEKEQYFKMIFLLDDFSGSGYTCSEKIKVLFNKLKNPDSEISTIAKIEDVYIYVIIYIATETAIAHIKRTIDDTSPGITPLGDALPVQLLSEITKIQGPQDEEFLRLVNNDKYYDHKVFDEHFRSGGKQDAKLGYAGCSLPVVLSHNCPNDSVFLLWAYRDLKNLRIKGLFPRVPRHWSEESDE